MLRKHGQSYLVVAIWPNLCQSRQSFFPNMDGLDDESSPFLVPFYPEDDDLYEDYILQDVTREEDDGCSHCAEQGSEAPVERHESQPSLSESQFLMQIVAQEKAEREGTQVSTSDSLPGLFTESDSELTGDAEPKPKKQKTKLKTAEARKPKKHNLEKKKLKPKEEQLESLDDLNFDAEVEQPDVAFEEDLNFDSDNEAILVQEPNTCFPDKLSTYLEEWDEVACHVQQTKRRLRGKQSGPSNDAAPEAQVPQPPPSTRTSDRAAFLMGLTGKQYRFLRRAEAPIILFQMLFFITGLLPSIRVPDVDCVDFYMGRGHIKECFDVDFRALGYEIADDCVMQNALTLQGLITMILYGMRLCSCGLSHWGTVCSSWVFLSRSSTGRTTDNVRGRTSCLSVRQGNTQVSRMCLTLLLLQAKGTAWILEQPASSIMYLSDAMQWYWRRFQWHAVSTSMGAYGGPTLKPTKLRSNKSWVSKMMRKPTDDDQVRFRELKGLSQTAVQLAPHSDGRKRCTGNAKALKDSQTYPLEYAKHLTRTFKSIDIDLSDAESSDSDYPGLPGDDIAWQDLDVERLPDMLGQRTGRMPFNIS